MRKTIQLNWIPFTHLHTSRSNTVSWIARDKDNDLYIYTDKPKRDKMWLLWISVNSDFAKLSYNGDKNLIGKTITWDDEPVEI